MATKWRVTRLCCTSGMCLLCRAVATGGERKRIVQGENLDLDMAERYMAGWAGYEPKMEPMEDRPRVHSRR